MISFQMESWKIAMARTGDHGNCKPYHVIIRSAFNILEVNSSSSSLIWRKS